MNISDIPFPFFMTVNMTLLFLVMSFASAFIDHKAKPAADRLAISFVFSMKIAGLAALAMGGLFAVMTAAVFITKSLWLAYQFAIA